MRLDDRVKKDRSWRKVSKDDYKNIQSQYETGNITMVELAIIYGLCQQMISKIVAKKL